MNLNLRAQSPLCRVNQILLFQTTAVGRVSVYSSEACFSLQQWVLFVSDYSSEEEVFRHMKFLLQQLPQLSYGLLRFLLRFLGHVASVQRDAWPPGALAAVFGPDIFQ